ncbi:hypothetical protein V6N11_082013 [Hibiscus sabdariffa]|uniref:SS18 N-terminal domain-containing protein n=2 Tax=Hibiscus sabdariffa TaxID=183260 RepID=A0ABR1ZS10_9ROSI
MPTSTQYLDENKSLILKIVESQNSGKLSECTENQARRQRNLMYLAAIADSQPQPSIVHAQFPSGGIRQPGATIFCTATTNFARSARHELRWKHMPSHAAN